MRTFLKYNFLKFCIPKDVFFSFVFQSSGSKMMIYSAGTIQIYILGLKCGSVLSIVKIGKQSLFPLCDHVLTHKIFLLMQAQKVVIFGFKVAV